MRLGTCSMVKYLTVIRCLRRPSKSTLSIEKLVFQILECGHQSWTIVRRTASAEGSTGAECLLSPNVP